MYSDAFFRYVADHADQSAQVILPIVRDVVAPASVVDYGCARGHWLRTWQELGARDVLGYDGTWVDPEALVIARDEFRAVDLGTPPAAPRRFDLAMSLEVAEHLPPASGPALVAALCAAAPAVLFSAAFPGQGGDGHVNERPLRYWTRLFADRGYATVDVERRAVRGDRRVAPWYRANVLLFVDEARLAELPAVARDCRVAPDDVPVLAPLGLRARALLLRPLPPAVVTRLSTLRSRWHATRARRHRPDG